MTEEVVGYPEVKCKIPNCTKRRLEWDKAVYFSAPNGRDEKGNPVQVTNCTICPIGVGILGRIVADCGSYKPMDAA